MKLSIYRKPRVVSPFEEDIAKTVYGPAAGFFDRILGRFSPNIPEEDMRKIPKWALSSGLFWDEIKGRWQSTRGISMDITDS